MGKSKDLATGAAYQDQTESDTRYVNTAGDTMSGGLTVNGGNLSVNSTSEAAHRYLYLNTGATQDGHILFQRGGSNKFQISADTNGHLYTWNYAKNGTSFRINADGSVITPHQPMFHVYHTSGDTFTTTDSKHLFNTERIDVGSNFDTTNSRFVAPVAGYYFFTWGGTIVMSSADAYVTSYLRKNGSVAGGMRTRTNFYGTGTQYAGMAGAEVQYMAANDYMEVWHYSNSGNAYSYQGEYVYTGFLIG